MKYAVLEPTLGKQQTSTSYHQQQQQHQQILKSISPAALLDPGRLYCTLYSYASNE